MASGAFSLIVTGAPAVAARERAMKATVRRRWNTALAQFHDIPREKAHRIVASTVTINRS